MRTTWRTAWQGQDIVVYREDQEVDRVSALEIERVVFVHRESGDSPGDLQYAIVELAEECLVFPDYTGFAGRVNFERQAFWAERGCVFWVGDSHASLPGRLRRGALAVAPLGARIHAPATRGADAADGKVAA